MRNNQLMATHRRYQNIKFFPNDFNNKLLKLQMQ